MYSNRKVDLSDEDTEVDKILNGLKRLVFRWKCTYLIKLNWFTKNWKRGKPVNSVLSLLDRNSIQVIQCICSSESYDLSFFKFAMPNNNNIKLV